MFTQTPIGKNHISPYQFIHSTTIEDVLYFEEKKKYIDIH